MLLENIIDLLIGNLSTVLAESIVDILPRDFSRTIYVKGVKDGLKFFFGQELLNVDCGGNKLAIVDFVIVGVIDFLNEFLNFFLRQIYI